MIILTEIRECFPIDNMVVSLNLNFDDLVQIITLCVEEYHVGIFLLQNRDENCSSWKISLFRGNTSTDTFNSRILT